MAIHNKDSEHGTHNFTAFSMKKLDALRDYSFIHRLSNLDCHLKVEKYLRNKTKQMY